MFGKNIIIIFLTDSLKVETFFRRPRRKRLIR